jgi:hypothetical protein
MKKHKFNQINPNKPLELDNSMKSSKIYNKFNTNNFKKTNNYRNEKSSKKFNNSEPLNTHKNRKKEYSSIKKALLQSHLVLLRNKKKIGYTNKIVKFEYLIRSLKQLMHIFNSFLNYVRCQTVFIMVGNKSQKDFINTIILKLNLSKRVIVSCNFQRLHNNRRHKIVLFLDGSIIHNQCSTIHALLRRYNYLVFQMDAFPRKNYYGAYHLIADDTNIKTVIFFLLIIKKAFLKSEQIRYENMMNQINQQNNAFRK